MMLLKEQFLLPTIGLELGYNKRLLRVSSERQRRYAKDRLRRQLVLLHRPPSLLQPAVHRAGHRLTCRRVLDRYLQHQHVHLRDRSRLHPDGACHLLQDEGDHRLHQRGQHHGAGYCFFKKWANPGLFFIYFRLFQTQITIFTTN